MAISLFQSTVRLYHLSPSTLRLESSWLSPLSWVPSEVLIRTSHPTIAELGLLSLRRLRLPDPRHYWSGHSICLQLIVLGTG